MLCSCRSMSPNIRSMRDFWTGRLLTDEHTHIVQMVLQSLTSPE
jgi:hypothetical protein